MLSNDMDMQLHTIIDCFSRLDKAIDERIKVIYKQEILAHTKKIIQLINNNMLVDESYPIGTGNGGRNVGLIINALLYVFETSNTEDFRCVIKELGNLQDRINERDEDINHI